MRTTVHKLFWAWDFDKEEKWLNEMAAKGLALAAVGYCSYTFEDSAPGAYSVCLEMLENMPEHVESRKYIGFVEETGAEYLGAVMRWAYFRKKKSDGEFLLYSDYKLRAVHLNRILILLGVMAAINLANGINNLWLYFGVRVMAFNLGVAVLCLAVGLWLGYGFLHIYAKKRRLEKEGRLYES